MMWQVGLGEPDDGAEAVEEAKQQLHLRLESHAVRRVRQPAARGDRAALGEAAHRLAVLLLEEAPHADRKAAMSAAINTSETMRRSGRVPSVMQPRATASLRPATAPPSRPLPPTTPRPMIAPAAPPAAALPNAANAARRAGSRAAKATGPASSIEAASDAATARPTHSA